MKRLFFLSVVLSVFVVPVFGAARSGVVNAQSGARTMVMPMNKYGSSLKNDSGVARVKANSGAEQVTAEVAVIDDNPKPAVPNRDKERLICLSNNIGANNTFVWAAKDSNTANYATMVEDTEHPENNVCFVLVGMRSVDSRISTADIQPRYFEWGQSITCGSWIDEDAMQNRILEAKKKARTWGTVGGAVGGAGVGVGSMELFGNKLIGGAVMGQKDLEKNDMVAWYQSKAGELEKSNPDVYAKFKNQISELKTVCGQSARPSDCDMEPYRTLLDAF